MSRSNTPQSRATERASTNRAAEQESRNGSDHHTTGHTSDADDAHSASPTEKYQQRVAQAQSVWFSGLFTGRSYVPRPRKVNEAELSESAKEEMLEETTYTVPRGYKFYSHNVPEILNPVPQGGLSTALIVHMVLNFIAFVFTLAASCPVAWYKGHGVVEGTDAYKGRKFTLWKATGGTLPEVSVHSMKNCPIEKQFFQTIAASTIMGCAFTVIAIILAGVRFKGRGSYGWTLVFSLIAFAWTLCGNAMSISLYYLSRCDGPRFSNMARLDAGFALTLIAWVFQLGGILSLVLTTKLNVGPVLKKVRVVDSYYMLLLLVSLAFIIIGNATTVWKRRFHDANVSVVRVTYWHTELIKPDGTSIYYGRAFYGCGAFGKRMKASISFLILSTVSIFLAIVFGIPAFVSRGCRIASLVFSIITEVFLIISWVTAVAVFYRKSCTVPVPETIYAAYPGVPSGVFHGKTDFPGYSVQEGVILPIIAWILTLIAIVVNFAIPWPEVES